jgi:hypothetical protein
LEVVTAWLAEREVWRISLSPVVRPQPRQEGRDVHTFEIVTTDGHELGRVELGRPDWPVGSVIYRGGPQSDLRVVERRETDGAPILVVEEL